MKQVLQDDLFDSELEIAAHLNKNGFIRGAGAIAGVVLENHLKNICTDHKIKINKGAPAINDFVD